VRIEPEQVRAAVAKLNEWGCDIDGSLEDDLIAEFDVKIDKDLGGGGQHRHGDLDTSKMAARMDRTHSRTKVLMAFIRAAATGLTNDEMYLVVDPESIRDRDSWVPRVGELKKMGLVKQSGRTRRGARGVQQQVHVASSEGVAFAKQKGWGS
jgi:hypothetical protein